MPLILGNRGEKDNCRDEWQELFFNNPESLIFKKCYMLLEK
jgi:hypothetical protein